MLIYSFNQEDLKLHAPLHQLKKPSIPVNVYKYKIQIDKLNKFCNAYLIEPQECPNDHWLLFLHGAKYLNEDFEKPLSIYGKNFLNFNIYTSNYFENPYSFAVLSSILKIKIIYILYPGLGGSKPHYSYLIYPQYYLNICLETIGVKPNDHLTIQCYSAGAIVLNVAIQHNLFSAYKIDSIYLSSPFLYSNKYHGFSKIVFEGQNKSISEFCLPELEEYLKKVKNLNFILSQMYTISFLILTLLIGFDDLYNYLNPKSLNMLNNSDNGFQAAIYLRYETGLRNDYNKIIDPKCLLPSETILSSLIIINFNNLPLRVPIYLIHHPKDETAFWESSQTYNPDSHLSNSKEHNLTFYLKSKNFSVHQYDEVSDLINNNCSNYTYHSISIIETWKIMIDNWTS